MSKKYTFREITEKNELEKLFRLRYQVYANSELAPFLKVNKYQIDIDIYDLHSRLYGIFCEDEIVAGVRAVIDKREYYNPRVYDIGSKYKFFNKEANSQEKLINRDYADFPFLSYQSIPKEIKLFYQNQSKDKKVFMSSRCVIDANHRGLKTIQFLTEGIITIGNLLCGENIGLAVTDVNLSHSRFYCRYGFSPIVGASQYTINRLTGICLAMALSINLSSSSIPEYLHPKFEVMLEEYRKTSMLQQYI